jgi:hypothetical protein
MKVRATLLSAVMALVVALLGAAPAWPATGAGTDTLAAGEQLTSGQSISSALGRFHLRMQADGNVVLRGADSRAVWDSGTSGSGGARLAMQPDGNVVVYSASGRALWHAGTHGNAGSRLVVQYDGNLVVYRPDDSVVWSTGVFSGDTLLVGQHLTGNQVLVAATGGCFLRTQTDGNVVVYVQGGAGLAARWDAGTWGFPGAYLALQRDGNLVLYSAADRPLWATGTLGAGGTRLVVQHDCNVVLYRSDDRAVWSTTFGREA